MPAVNSELSTPPPKGISRFRPPVAGGDQMKTRNCQTNSPVGVAREFVGHIVSTPLVERTGNGFRPRVSHLAPFDGGLATGSRRSAHLHGLLPPILSAHGYRLAHLLWYRYRDLLLLSGRNHCCSGQDNRYRRQS